MNAINPSLSAGYPFIDPAIDRRLDAVPDSIKNQVSEVVNALLEQGIHPTPERVAAVMGRLARAPLERNLLNELLMRHWWVALNDTVEPDDPDALAAHLAWAPVREHPGHWYLAGFIAGLLAGHWYGFGCGHNAAARECWGDGHESRDPWVGPCPRSSQDDQAGAPAGIREGAVALKLGGATASERSRATGL